MPDEPEALGLLALMLLQDSRRDARVDADGELVLLEDQDRSRWDRDEIAEGRQLVERALRRGAPGPYQLQAAIAGLPQPATTRPTGRRSSRCTASCSALPPSPVVELNRAVAVAMADGPEEGLAAVDAHRGASTTTATSTPTRADLLRRLGRDDEARAAYERALELTPDGIEREFLAARLSSV